MTQLNLTVETVTKYSGLYHPPRPGSDVGGGSEFVVQMVQELLRVAAQTNLSSGAEAYFPETFLTRW